jgi:hypothetical protein
MSSETDASRARPLRGPERRRRETPAATVALMALLAGVACGGRSSAAPGVLPESTYVQVMARLSLTDSLLAPAEYARPANLSRDSAHALVLRRWGVADSALLSYAARLGDDPSRLKDVWNRIRTVADSLARAGWIPAAAEAR